MAKIIRKTNNLCIKHYSEDQIVLLLIDIAEQKRLAQNYSNRFRNNPLLAGVFSYDDVHGELTVTLTQVVNAWKTYQKVKYKNRKIKIAPEHRIKVSSKLKLDTVSNLEGYFVNAFKNNMSKIYNKFTTEKRSAQKSSVSLDNDKMEKHIKNALEAATAIDPMADLEYETSMRQIGQYLLEEDLKANQLTAKQLGTEFIPLKSKSNLAGLWEALQDPSIKKEMDKVKDRFGWTEHVFKSNRDRLEQKVRAKFKVEGLELLRHVEEKNSQVYLNQDTQNKKQKELKDLYQKIPLEVHTVFSMTTDKNKKKKYSVVVSLDEYREGKWVSVKSKSKTLNLNQASSFDDAKAKLSKMVAEDRKTIESLALQKKAA